MFSVHPQGLGYTPAKSGQSQSLQSPKAYKMLNGKLNFNDAKSFCKDEGSVLAMPKTVEDVNDIKEFDCKYLEFKLMFGQILVDKTSDSVTGLHCTII